MSKNSPAGCDDKPAAGKRYRRPLAILLTVLAAVVLLPVYLLNLLVYGLPDWWLADLFVHFKLHYLVAGGIGLIVFALLRRPWLSCIAAVTVALNVFPVIQYFNTSPLDSAIGAVKASVPSAGSAGQSTIDTPATAQFRVASANIYKHNERYDLVERWIRRLQPDVVVLLEAHDIWHRQMQARLPEYPHQVLVTGPGKVGKLIVSRLRFDHLQELPAVGRRSPIPVITFQSQQAPFKLFALHASWPLKKQWADFRNRELAQLSQSARASTVPFVAVGDFNITPFSRHFQQTLRDGQLTRAAAGRGWLPTWPTFFLPAGIQIDHMLTSAQIGVIDYQVGDGLGSDHRWIMADITVPRQTGPATLAD